MKAAVGCLLLLIIRLDAWAAAGTDNQVKGLAERYSQIEAQLGRSIHYIRKTESDGGATIEQAWFNGAGDLIKLAIERSGPSGRELTEYFAPDLWEPNAYNAKMFMLTRKESPLADGGTQVDESRKYFGEKTNGENGELIRELRKSARFKVGESTDTQHVPNVVVDLAKRPADQRREGEEEPYFYRPSRIGQELPRAGPPDVDPFVNVEGDREKFRVIHGTASPDGRYAIALGFQDKIKWDAFMEQNNYDIREEYDVEDVDGLRNYVVDLGTQKILGETGSAYFYTLKRNLHNSKAYGFRECNVTWSPDSTVFVQLYTAKWDYDDCHTGKIVAGPKLAGVVDLGEIVNKETSGFLKGRFSSDSLEKLLMRVDQVNNDGRILINVSSVVQSGKREGKTLFSLNERLRLRLETVSIRKVPQE